VEALVVHGPRVDLPAEVGHYGADETRHQVVQDRLVARLGKKTRAVSSACKPKTFSFVIK
jgi:hypothetical protein